MGASTFLASYFSPATSVTLRVAYVLAFIVLAAYVGCILFGRYFAPPCDLERLVTGFKNVEYNADYDACRFRRLWVQGGLNNVEVEMCRRVMLSVLCGSFLGNERGRAAIIPASVRTVSMISLGACMVTIASMFAYMSGPVTYDSARATAQIAKGVGILCGATTFAASLADGSKELRGATTSTSIFAAASIGSMAGGGMYAPALFTTCVAVSYLRFGIRAYVRPGYRPIRMPSTGLDFALGDSWPVLPSMPALAEPLLPPSTETL